MNGKEITTFCDNYMRTYIGGETDHSPTVNAMTSKEFISATKKMKYGAKDYFLRDYLHLHDNDTVKVAICTHTGYNIDHVTDPSNAVMAAAVNQNANILHKIKNPPFDIVLMALQLKPGNLGEVDDSKYTNEQKLEIYHLLRNRLFRDI